MTFKGEGVYSEWNIQNTERIYKVMFCINLESHDPFFNLAVDEYFVKSSNKNYFILGSNNPSVIIGKHQVAHREADTRFVTEHRIPVLRRISGGGTVFHDMGNLNYTIIQNSEPGRQIDFPRYTRPVISFLSSLGVDARIEGKSDIKTGGLKISGNAEHVCRKRVLHHGTLLFDADLDLLKNSLRKDTSRYITRGVGSNPSPVTNLKGKLSIAMGMDEFRSEMMKWVLENMEDAEIYHLSEEERSGIESLEKSKYRCWEWNYGYGPEYRFSGTFKTNGVLHTCSLLVKDGVIEECIIKGSDAMTGVAKKLAGCRHMVQDIAELARKEHFSSTDFDIFDLF